LQVENVPFSTDWRYVCDDFCDALVYCDENKLPTQPTTTPRVDCVLKHDLTLQRQPVTKKISTP
jgi:hypothetical protein